MLLAYSSSVCCWLPLSSISLHSLWEFVLLIEVVNLKKTSENKSPLDAAATRCGREEMNHFFFFLNGLRWSFCLLHLMLTFKSHFQCSTPNPSNATSWSFKCHLFLVWTHGCHQPLSRHFNYFLFIYFYFLFQ